MDRIVSSQSVEIVSFEVKTKQGRGALLDRLSNNSYFEVDTSADPIDQAMESAQVFNENAINSFQIWRDQQSAHAQERNQQGLYGICEDCGNPIPTARMTANPDATRCIGCQIIFERRNVHSWQW